MIKTANLTGSVSRNAGGLFESVRRLVQSLKDTGMDICVFGSEDEHTAADMGAWAPVPVQAFHPIGPQQFGYSMRFQRALVEFSPDLVHTHGLWLFPSIATHQYHRRRGVPYIISVHGMLDPWAVKNSRWKKVIARLLYEGSHLRGAACLRALCEDEARAIRAYGLKNPICVIPNGIDVPEIGNQKAESRNPPWQGNIEPGRKVLLFLSRIHPKKGLVNLLRAWKQTLNSQPSTLNSWVLAIAGWDQGGHEDELKRLASELGIQWSDAREHRTSNIEHPTSNRKAESREQRAEIRNQKSNSSVSEFQLSAFSLLFLGPQFNEAKAACYRNCDGFILPSFSEGVPMVVLEAWAYGKPVLMTPECNLPEGFAHGAAIRIEPNVESIEQGLREFFLAPSAERDAMGRRGRQLIENRYTWPQVAREMCAVYEWILGGGKKPECVV